ncbi:glycosyl hydrolase family 88 [Enterococcus lactis]|nr:glycosyl hydrolase family 88 [Enterococcus lactis]
MRIVRTFQTTACFRSSSFRLRRDGSQNLGRITKNYTTKQVDGSNGLPLHAVYDKNSLKGVDECVIWGDYFYVEGITRLAKKWYCYW